MILKPSIHWLLVAMPVAAALDAVGAAEATGQALGMSPLFTGIVLLAAVGGAAAIAMAGKNKMDLSVRIAMGSSTQIALFVTPVEPADRARAPDPVVQPGRDRGLVPEVLVGTLVAGDGRSHWFKGVQLVAFYLIRAAILT